MGGTALCLSSWMFSPLLKIFCTCAFRISPVGIGTMVLISECVDAAIDPVMGVIADGTEAKPGKFRPSVLWGSIPFAGALLYNLNSRLAKQIGVEMLAGKGPKP